MPASPHRLALVTGTSSGIGEATARELLDRGWRVVGAARRAAPIEHPQYSHLSIDLAELTGLASTLDSKLLPLIATPGIGRLGLVNNAAQVALLGPVVTLDPTAVLSVYTVNTAAPILLMGWFLRHGRAGIPLRIVNVSSGAARKPYPGLAAYGSSKAALRLAGMVLAAELNAPVPGHPARPDASILSYEPGLVDTPMQTAARTSPAETLPVVPVFVNWKETGALVAPIVPARRIADYLDADGHDRWTEDQFEAPAPGAPAT